MNDETVAFYRQVAAGGVGMIITGDFSVVPRGSRDEDCGGFDEFSYDDVRIDGYDRLIAAVRQTAPSCKIIAQLSGDYRDLSPSGVKSVFARKPPKTMSRGQIRTLVRRFIVAIEGAKHDGFDGIQFHAAHGSLLCQFLSPYTNRRTDEYGGSMENRARLIGEIVSGARHRVSDFPILIKLNCTDYLEGGIDINNFPELAREIEKTGIDAIEVSGGMRDCLVRSEQELGFRPIYPPESQTRLARPEKQSYFLKYVEGLKLEIPLILVGGNRNVELLEEILGQGTVDFVSLCRPLICEPDLPRRWLEGRGKNGTACVSCNSCIYDQILAFEEKRSGVAKCLMREDRQRVRLAQNWISSWAKKRLPQDDSE